LPKSVTSGRIIKNVDEDGNKHYDFQFENKRGYKTTIEGLSEKFNKEYWNYAKLISGVLRWRMPIDRVIKLVDSLQLDSESINTWKNGVERALKKYVTDGTVRIADMKLSFIRRDALSAKPVERQDADNGLLYNVITKEKKRGTACIEWQFLFLLAFFLLLFPIRKKYLIFVRPIKTKA